ncbi:hypothetical protein [Caballeronia sp. BCC1704]|uniref:hypothetical protein n=1 Tax=Caballeronia sp. BCC1704 TaxID=2676300 RepID=UPI00158A62CC|nr:hypothetical protein [Caballeronia sp. BCC1704]
MRATLTVSTLAAENLVQNVADTDVSLTPTDARRYPDFSLRQQRTGLATGNDPRRTKAAIVRFFCVRTPCALFYGRALVGVRLRTPVCLGRRFANPTMRPATPFGDGSRVSNPSKEGRTMRHIPARPEQSQSPAPLDIIQRALRDAATAPTVFDALDIAGDALRQLGEIARAEVRHA